MKVEEGVVVTIRFDFFGYGFSEVESWFCLWAEFVESFFLFLFNSKCPRKKFLKKELLRYDKKIEFLLLKS